MNPDADGMTNKQLVFGDDGSPAADLAWLWINNHPWRNWRLEVVTAVVPNLVFEGSSKPGATTARRVDRPVSTEAAFTTVDQITIEEDPRIALSRSADLLVIGPRGPGLAKALHLGSTAEWLLSKPPSPMVIARHGRRTERIVICHDGSAHAQAAVEAVCAMPWVADVTVMVLSVDDATVNAEQAISDATAPLAAAGATVEHRILPGDGGDATNALRAYIDRYHADQQGGDQQGGDQHRGNQHGVDLIALGTRGLTGLKRVVVGSTATAIAHRSEYSVLLACADVTAP